MQDPDQKGIDTRPDVNADEPIEKGRNTKWLWVGMIVLVTVAAVIVFLNPDGDEPDLPDGAVTTQEERLNTDLTDESELTDEALEDVRGVNQVDTVTPPGMDEPADDDAEEPAVDPMPE